MSFMLKIDAARRNPLDELAVMWFTQRTQKPSVEFCRHAAGISATDADIARRLGVGLSTVREWRSIGRQWQGSGSRN